MMWSCSVKVGNGGTGYREDFDMLGSAGGWHIFIFLFWEECVRLGDNTYIYI